MKEILILFLIFYLLILFQTSFLIHFNNFLSQNLILILVILINIFESQKKNSGLFSAFIGGFFLDIFSENFFGFYILISLTIATFIKFIFKRYVRIPTLKRA